MEVTEFYKTFLYEFTEVNCSLMQSLIDFKKKNPAANIKERLELIQKLQKIELLYTTLCFQRDEAWKEKIDAYGTVRRLQQVIIEKDNEIIKLNKVIENIK